MAICPNPQELVAAIRALVNASRNKSGPTDEEAATALIGIDVPPEWVAAVLGGWRAFAATYDRPLAREVTAGTTRFLRANILPSFKLDNSELTCRLCGLGVQPPSRTWHKKCWLAIEPHTSKGFKALTKQALKRSAGKCESCQVSLKLLILNNLEPWRRVWDVDHIIPLFKGGTHALENLQILCRDCHLVKTGADFAKPTKLEKPLLKPIVENQMKIEIHDQTEIIKPMLAGKAPEDLSKLQYPLLATPKLDGIRCLVINGKAVSRTFKPIPNHHIREAIEKAMKGKQVDGEILIHNRDFNQLSGDIRREEGEPDFYFAIFDYVSGSVFQPYNVRMVHLERMAAPGFVKKIFPRQINDPDELTIYEVECLAAGYEGVMVRAPDSPYKCGRSSAAEGYLLKVKRFEDSEAVVTGFEEEMENQNTADKDAFGRTKRSTHQDNMVPKGRLGKLIVEFNGVADIGIGTGYDAKTRVDLWERRDELIGKIVKFKHQPSGAKDGGKPRFPVFLGFRDKWDM